MRCLHTFMKYAWYQPVVSCEMQLLLPASGTKTQQEGPMAIANRHFMLRYSDSGDPCSTYGDHSRW